MKSQITESEPDSVVTGRDLEAIGSQEDHVWQSKETKKRNLSRLAQRRLQFDKEKARGNRAARSTKCVKRNSRGKDAELYLAASGDAGLRSAGRR